MKELLDLCFRNGFVLKNDNSYYGQRGIWEYGHLGLLLRQNLKQSWWKRFVKYRENCIGFESSLLVKENVLAASGHLENFAYPVIRCNSCSREIRLDQYISRGLPEINPIAEEMTDEQLKAVVNQLHILCNYCQTPISGDLYRYNFLFKSMAGPREDRQKSIFLRPETAENALIQLGKLAQIHRLKIPFSVAQIGYVFRNEISPGNFLFRVRSFEQMELDRVVAQEFEQETIESLISESIVWYRELGIPEHAIRVNRYNKANYTHALKADADIDVKFPFGWEDVLAVTSRRDFDLKRHLPHNRRDLVNLQDSDGRFPYIVESSTSVERAFLAVLTAALTLEVDGRKRLSLPFNLAPIKVTVLPLESKHIEQSVLLTRKLQQALDMEITCETKGSIGKRYVRADEIGVPICIAYDDSSIQQGQVTVRDRDTRRQDLVQDYELSNYIIKWLKQEHGR